MRRIDSERRENRINCLAEIFFKIRTLVLGNIGIVVKTYPLGIEGRRDVIPPAAVLILHHSLGACADERKRLLRREAIGPCLRRLGLHLLLETGNPHLKKLIQVRADDTEKLQSLEYRVVLTECLIQDTLVELQPACLPIHEIFLLGKIHRAMLFPRRDWSRADFKQKPHSPPTADRILLILSESNQAQQGVWRPPPHSHDY